MSYTPTTWTTGDTITATKLNKIENGIASAGSALIATASNLNNTSNPLGYGSTLDKTFTEIYTALSGGIPVYVKAVISTSGLSDYTTVASLGQVVSAFKYNNDYRVYVSAHCSASINGYNFAQRNALICFDASSASGYPSASKCVAPIYYDDAWE